VCLQPAGGNVGIGTVSPGYKLDVNGPVYAGNNSFLLSTYTGTASSQYFGKAYGGRILAGMEIENTTLGGNYSQKLHFRTHSYGVGEAIRMTIAEGGNVGIGTNAPGTILEVNGTIESPIIKRNASAATDTFNYILNGPRPGTTSNGASHFINGSTRSADGGSNMYTIRNDSGNLRLGKAGSDTLLEGDVGIGTASPRRTLDVYGELIVAKADNTGTIIVGETQTNPTTRLSNYVVGNSTYVNTAGSTPVFGPNLLLTPNAINGGALWATAGYGEPTLYGGDLVLYGGDINASGNDGTGAGQYYAGHTYIVGGVAFTGNNVGDSGRTYNGSIYFQTGVDDTTSSTDQGRYIRMSIKPGGNVGIGTTSPTHPLHILNGDVSYIRTGPNTTYNSSLYLGATLGGAWASNECGVITTNGNLHLDAGSGRDIYLNYYSGNNVNFGSGGGVVHSSDDRLKTQEELIENATQTLMKLKPQKYLKAIRLPEDNDVREPRTEAGLIAQDVWYDAPELRFIVKPGDNANPSEEKPPEPVTGDIQQDPDYSDWGTTPAGLSYTCLIPYLIKSNQELYTEIQALETQLASVLARLDALENN